MTSRGLAFYIALRENTRAGDPRVPATSARVEPRAPRRRVRKLGVAVAASMTVFVKLLRRPVGGTVVVLVPREGVPDGSGTVVVSNEWLPRAS